MTLVEIVQETGDEWLKGFMAAQYLANHQYEEYQALRNEYVHRKGLEDEIAEAPTHRHFQEDQSARSNSSNKT